MMNKTVFGSTAQLAEYLIDCDKVDKHVEAVVCFDRAEELLRYFLTIPEGPKIGIFELENKEFDYFGEYTVDVFDGYLSICHARREPTEEWPDKFYNIEADEILLDGDADSSIIGYCYSGRIFELEFESEIEEDESEGCTECDCCGEEANETPCYCSIDEFMDDLSEILEFFFGMH